MPNPLWGGLFVEKKEQIMATDITIRFKSFLPGGGKDAAGNPKQGKTRVVGQIAVTDYTRGGEPLAPVDLALTAIDHLDLRVANEVGGPSGDQLRSAHYNQTDDLFYLVTMSSADGTDFTTEYADEATETVEFVAEGDSSHDAELL
jgi:hypothetical protein